MRIPGSFQRRSTTNQPLNIRIRNINTPHVDINIPFNEQDQTFVFDRERFTRAINDQNEQLLRALLRSQQPLLPNDRTLFPSRTDAAQSTEPPLPSGASSLRNRLELRCASDSIHIPDEILNNEDFLDYLDEKLQRSSVHATCAIGHNVPKSLSKINKRTTSPHVFDFDALTRLIATEQVQGKTATHPITRCNIESVERDFDNNPAFEAFILREWELFTKNAPQSTEAASLRRP